MTKRRIILDTRRPSELDDEATAATGSDWLTIQKNGEDRLRKMRPGVLAPPLPSALANEATSVNSTDWMTVQKFNEAFLRKIRPLDAMPDIPISKLPEIVGVKSLASVSAATTDLTTSFVEQVRSTITLTASTTVLVLISFEGYAERASGTGQIGLEVKSRRNTSDVGPVRYACYLSGGGSGFATIGGAASWWFTDTAPRGSTYYSIHARRISGTTSGRRNSAAVQVFAFNA